MYCNIYYVTVMAWAVCYFANTLRTTELPWMECGHWFNTNSCVTYKAAIEQNLTSFSQENITLPIFEFWNNYILRKSKGFEDVVILDNWPMVFSLVASWVMVYFCIFRGTKSTGKVVYFTSLFPFLMLLILLVRGCTLEGASNGIYYYINPNITELKRPEVWVNAGCQVCYSYAICFCVLIAYGSFSKFDSDCYKRAFYLSISCSMTSFIGGFAVFAVLGNMAKVLHVEVKDVVKSGPGLAFITYPTALSFMPIPQFWNACFFLMLITLAVDSQFCLLEGMMTLVYDKFFWPRKNRKLFTLIVSITFFLIGLLFLTSSGIYIFELFNYYAVSGVALLWLVTWQSVGIGWTYGSKRYFEIIKQMIGYYPSIYMSFCFQFATPILAVVVMAFYIAQDEPATVDDYIFPSWATSIGWILSLSSSLCIPGWAIYEMSRHKGSLVQRFRKALKPQIQVPTGNN